MDLLATLVNIFLSLINQTFPSNVEIIRIVFGNNKLNSMNNKVSNESMFGWYMMSCYVRKIKP